jgi:DNA mismatch endonuclease (patch repair protein)
MIDTKRGRLAHLTTLERSELMGKIRSKDTKPELIVQQYLRGLGYHYELHDSKLPGKPDIVLSSLKTLIFVQGCFWHWHDQGCTFKLNMPKSELWRLKLVRNVERDIQQQTHLRNLGWRVLIVWECELKSAARGSTLSRITADLAEVF